MTASVGHSASDPPRNADMQLLLWKSKSTDHVVCIAIDVGDVMIKAEELGDSSDVRRTITSRDCIHVNEKVIGGKGASLLTKNLELVDSFVGYVTDTLNHADVVTAAGTSGSDAVPLLRS